MKNLLTNILIVIIVVSVCIGALYVGASLAVDTSTIVCK